MKRLLLGCVVVAATATATAHAEPSALWGNDGDLFDPTGRLMDWSFAGYHAGEDDIPDLAATLSVLDFGAVGDGTTDDTEAFEDALAAAEAADGAVVEVPAGTYVITSRLTLSDHVVLKGAGRNQTTLRIPVSLTDVYGNSGLDGGGTSSYSFGGAFIEVRGDLGSAVLADVAEPALRGAGEIVVDEASRVRVGQWIRITQTDVDGALMDRLHADLLDSGSDNEGDRGLDFHTRVAAVNGTTITLDRALPVDIDLGWSPDVRAVNSTVEEVGVEGMTIEFPDTAYPGHFNEQGFNAIEFRDLMHSWVRDVEIVNADYGVNLRSVYFSTVADVRMSLTSDRGNEDGHHGINNSYGGDNLVIGFDFAATLRHDLTCEWYAAGVVFTKGRGDDLRMDHHRAAPYSTLWTEIDAGLGESPFLSGGRADRGPHSAAYSTLWNVTAASPMEFPDDDFGPRMNFVGFGTDKQDAPDTYEWWFEPIAPASIEPQNLWEAMRDRRLGEPGGETDGGSDTGDDSTSTSTTGSETSGGTAATTAGTQTTAGGSDSSPPATASTTAPATVTASGSGEGTAATDTDGVAQDDPSGCGCRQTFGAGAPFSQLGFGLLFLLGIRRRR